LGVEDELPALVVELPRFSSSEEDNKARTSMGVAGPAGKEPWFTADACKMVRSQYHVGMLLLKAIMAKLLQGKKGEKLRVWRRHARVAGRIQAEQRRRLVHSADLAEALVVVAWEAILETSGLDGHVNEWKAMYQGLESKLRLREVEVEEAGKARVGVAARLEAMEATHETLRLKLAQSEGTLAKRAAEKSTKEERGDLSVLAAVQAAVVQGVKEAAKPPPVPQRAPCHLLEGELLTAEARPDGILSRRHSKVSIQLRETDVPDAPCSAQSTPRSVGSTASRSLKARVTHKANERRMSIQSTEAHLAAKDELIRGLQARLQLAELKQEKDETGSRTARSRRSSVGSNSSAGTIGSRVSAKALKEKVDKRGLEVQNEQLEQEVAELKQSMKDLRSESKELEASALAAEEKYLRKCREHSAQVDENSELEDQQADQQRLLREKLAKVEDSLGKIDQQRAEDREKQHRRLEDLIAQNEREKQSLREMYGASEEDAERHKSKLDGLLNDKAGLQQRVIELEEEIQGVKANHQIERDAVNHVYETALEDNADLGQKNHSLEEKVGRVAKDNRKAATLAMKRAVGRLRYRDLVAKLLIWRDGLSKHKRAQLESKVHESALQAKLHQEAFEVQKAEIETQLHNQADGAAAEQESKEEARAAVEQAAADARAEFEAHAAEEKEAFLKKAAEAEAATDANMQHAVQEYETAMASLQRRLQNEKQQASMRLLRQFIGHMRHGTVMVLLQRWQSGTHRCQLHTAADRFESLVDETEKKLDAVQTETDVKLAEAETMAQEKVNAAEQAASERVAELRKEAEETAAEAVQATEEARREAAEAKLTVKERMESMKKAKADEVR